jgi:hypothetical protein
VIEKATLAGLYAMRAPHDYAAGIKNVRQPAPLYLVTDGIA